MNKYTTCNSVTLHAVMDHILLLSNSTSIRFFVIGVRERFVVEWSCLIAAWRKQSTKTSLKWTTLDPVRYKDGCEKQKYVFIELYVANETLLTVKIISYVW